MAAVVEIGIEEILVENVCSVIRFEGHGFKVRQPITTHSALAVINVEVDALRTVDVEHVRGGESTTRPVEYRRVLKVVMVPGVEHVIHLDKDVLPIGFGSKAGEVNSLPRALLLIGGAVPVA